MLKESISGIRGIVGDGLTPELIIEYCFAFAKILPEGVIVIGRDSRVTGEAISSLISGALRLAGRNVIDIGVQSTPTVEVYVDEVAAAGGIIITASHNPAKWNALKFLGKGGLFLDNSGFEALQTARNTSRKWADYKGIGDYERADDAVKRHIARILQLDFIDIEIIRKRCFKVVLDANGGTGAIALLPLLNKLNCEVIELNCIPDGNFIHEAEPIPQNLELLCKTVKANRADLGLATDPDADRLALVDENGEAIGEEFTLALGTAEVLNSNHGPIVVNLSTSAMVEALGQRVFRTPVGEINVTMKMLEIGSPVGGEGNGGLIVPACHPGRDGILAAVVILNRLSRLEKNLSQAVSDLPKLFMLKTKLEFIRTIDMDMMAKIEKKLSPESIDTSDGIRLVWKDRWAHLRASNTEPIVRIIAEAKTQAEAEKLVSELRSMMA